MPDDIQPPRRSNKHFDSETHGRRQRRTSLDTVHRRLYASAVSQPPMDSETHRPGHNPPPDSPTKIKKRHFMWWRKLNRNVRFAIISAMLLVFGAGALGYFYFTRPEGAPLIQISRAAKPPAPKTLASPLTGVQVAPELAARPITGIMIENSLDARPQSGIEQAGVVFEAIAEGGITRFLTLYQEAQPQYVGPVRSLRPYYIDWLVPFDASIAHVGGSPDALAQIRAGGKDLDQFFNSGSYWRQSGRKAPHNVYTSFEKMDALNSSKGYTSSRVASWPRKEDSPLVTPTAKAINVNISSANYNSHYDYEAASNSYLRSEGGKPHIATSSPQDSTGQQLKPKAVVVLVMPYSLAGKYSVYGTNGSGQLFVFQDGGVTTGSWSKADRSSQFVFSDSAGAALKLNSGQTWVTMVANAAKIDYAP
jgi:hypothetical protein